MCCFMWIISTLNIINDELEAAMHTALGSAKNRYCISYMFRPIRAFIRKFSRVPVVQYQRFSVSLYQYECFELGF